MHGVKSILYSYIIFIVPSRSSWHIVPGRLSWQAWRPGRSERSMPMRSYNSKSSSSSNNKLVVVLGYDI